MIIFFSLFIISLPLIFAIFLSHHKNRSKSIAPPGPSGLPFIGNLLQVARTATPHIYLFNLSQIYGPLMQLKFGPVPVLVVSSAKLAEEVMKTQDLAFCSRPKFRGQQRISYNGIDIAFSPYDSYWREVRKIVVTHLLSQRKVQSFYPIREDEISRMIKVIAGLSSSSSGRPVNLTEIAMTLTSNMIFRISFSRRYEYGVRGAEIRRFDRLLQEAQALAATPFVSDYFPALGWVERVLGMEKRLQKNFEELDSFYQELIDDHLNPMREKQGEEEDILDILLNLKRENSCSIELTWDHIKALLMDIFIGGTDSSASSINWTMLALMKAPHVMKKVQAEIRDFIGTKGRVDEDDLPNLPYLKAVVNETFRLYPSIPMLLPRETVEKCSLGGYDIQPKTTVYVNAWALGRDPDYWKNPLEFMPERFLEGNLDIRGKHFGVIPFGSGRRICVGMFMGIANVELAVANLLYTFNWEFPRGKENSFDVLPGLASHFKNGLLLVPKKWHT
ncbi:hypothetical protein C2S53_014601 [Perilla frutescens var. hirtella]|uniref:Cytochrome P450 n=1 Tax=Perilla frutescens var. hirtella TaxID=608512 RepID=A0AAD4IUN5_PERFH|nr:hypothetical protein C2S53_014601 [Perilla frutescens var. hirtella]